MTLRATQIAAERWLDEVVLQNVTALNVGADVNDTYTLPAGLGDVAIMELQMFVLDTATMVTAPEALGMYAAVQSAAGNNVDFVGVSRFTKVNATRLALNISPDPLVLWRQAELLHLVYPELDTNVSPTDDHYLLIKVVRVRPIEAPARGPVRLVR